MPADNDRTEEILTRLRRIEGQLRGIQRMYEEDRACEDVLTQLMAARAGLDQVGLMILDSQVTRCMSGMLPSDSPVLETLQRLIKTWTRFGPVAAESRR